VLEMGREGGKELEEEREKERECFNSYFTQ
jgi:hypothetical protein